MKALLLAVSNGETCQRCGGRGGWEGWPGFTCYECQGSGKVAKQRRRKCDQPAKVEPLLPGAYANDQWFRDGWQRAERGETLRSLHFLPGEGMSDKIKGWKSYHDVGPTR